MADTCVMHLARVAALVLIAGSNVLALKIDISMADIDRALTIARSTDAERKRFHADYIQHVDAPFIERAEIVSELRRVVLLAEEHTARGDRAFAYSLTRANDALHVWRRRVSIVVHVRFHPQNNYVDAPPVTLALVGNDRALIGVTRDAVLALPPGRKGDFVPVLGAIVNGSFEAEAIGQGQHEFVVTLDGKELGRVAFDFADVE